MSYLSAPPFAGFNIWKEEVEKFITSHYHNRKFWLNHTIKITDGLIYTITYLPSKGEVVPHTNDLETWIKNS